MDRARELVAQSKNELDASLADRDNPHLLTPHARLEGRGSGRFLVRAGETLVRAERVVLNTRARTARPSISGLDQVPLIDAENWINLREPPEHVLMLGEATSR
jgi:pyruvate/2-oxoglutarate dehydrogenase complex dihydrolipoamide dehydrogenase (E3) component